MSKELNTKFGKARIDNRGYWVITSGKEGNNGKKLHRLIYQEYHKCTLLPRTIIHHKNGCRTDNNINNLEMMTWEDHTRLHAQNRSEETLNKIREANIGKTHSKETRLKLRKANLGRKHTEKTKRKISQYRKGQKHTEETRRKISESHKDKIITEEHRLKLSKLHNTSGYYRVTIIKDKRMKQGVYYQYGYMINGKKRTISNKSIEDLEKKVKAKGLKWIKYDKEDN